MITPENAVPSHRPTGGAAIAPQFSQESFWALYFVVLGLDSLDLSPMVNVYSNRRMDTEIFIANSLKTDPLRLWQLNL
jgi:hypothetical protein